MTSHPWTKIGEGFFASGQISTDDMEAIKALGVRLIVNNRPDGEAADQPDGVEIEAAAREAGLAYIHLPVGAAGLTGRHLDQFDAAVKQTDGAALGYCLSGTRSMLLRAFAQARAGRAPGEIIAEASKAGYDIARYEEALAAIAD